MRDLQCARLINVVAVGTLAVTAIGCAGKSARAAKKWCKAQEECDPDYFEDNWDSLEECEEEILEYYDYYAEEYGEECARAMADFVLCYGRVYSRDCDYDDVEDECEDFYDDIEDACDS